MSLRHAIPAVALAAAVGVAATAPSRRQTVHVVEIRQFAYTPARIVAAVGDTIRWINHDPLPHTVTAGDSAFDSGRLEGRAEWMMVVEAAGEHDIVCTYHPTMGARLEVAR